MTEMPSTTAPLAAGLFGGTRQPAQPAEALVAPVVCASDELATVRRQSFSDLFKADGAQFKAA